MNSALVQASHGGAREGAGRKRREDWQDRFLKLYAARGGVYACAARVGVAPRVVFEHAQRDPSFQSLMDDARERYADRLEGKLEKQADETGNPVGYIVLLKKHRPGQFVEKHMNVNVNVDVDVPADQAHAVLRDMLLHLTPATQEAIGHGAYESMETVGAAEGERSERHAVVERP